MPFLAALAAKAGVMLIPVLKTMFMSLMTTAMVEWFVKHVVVSMLEVAIAKYAKRARKTPGKDDDRRARRFSAALNKIKDAWNVDDEEK